MVQRRGRSYSRRMRTVLAGAALASLSALTSGCYGTRLINIDTARVLDDGQWLFSGDVRFFGAEDRGTYQSYRISHALHGYQLELLGSFGEMASYDTGFATLRHGGTNWEIRAKKRLIGGGDDAVSVIAGLEFPNTPAQDEPHFALHLPMTITGHERTSLHIVPKFVFLEDNTISSLGLGLEEMLNDRLTLLLEVTPNLGGANTRDEHGRLADDPIWGIGLRWLPCEDGHWYVDAGLTNGKGQTSSFSVAPGILKSTAFYVSATYVP